MKAIVIAPAGPELSTEERRLFSRHRPAGFILFGRNLVDPGQARRLVTCLRESVQQDDIPILVDQEGGRVARLGPPHWRLVPPAATFSRLAATDPERAFEAVRINARLIAEELSDLGISVNCAPVLDVPQPGADPIIGDRAHGSDPATVTLLGEAVCEGLLSGGVLPVIKHIPGHGRAEQDSHKALPRVNAHYGELAAVDFRPFAALSGMPWAMTAHVVYSVIDDKLPATTSPLVIEQIIRGELDFDGVLISDDLGMDALDGPLPDRCRDALRAGCDLALHCSGDFDELSEILPACPEVGELAGRRMARAEALRLDSVTEAEAGLADRLAELIG